VLFSAGVGGYSGKAKSSSETHVTLAQPLLNRPDEWWPPPSHSQDDDWGGAAMVVLGGAGAGEVRKRRILYTKKGTVYQDRLGTKQEKLRKSGVFLQVVGIASSKGDTNSAHF
jgi:hypothetical protein